MQKHINQAICLILYAKTYDLLHKKRRLLHLPLKPNYEKQDI